MCTHTYLLLLYFANFFQQKFAQSNYNTYICSGFGGEIPDYHA